MRYYKNTKDNVTKIFRILKHANSVEGKDFLTVGEISRRSGLHKWIVSRTIDIWMSGFVDVTIPEELEHVGMSLKLIKLKDHNLKEEQILRGLEVRSIMR